MRWGGCRSLPSAVMLLGEVMLETFSLQLYHWSVIEGNRKCGKAGAVQSTLLHRVVPQQPCVSPCLTSLCGSIVVTVLPSALPGLGWVVEDWWRTWAFYNSLIPPAREVACEVALKPAVLQSAGYFFQFGQSAPHHAAIGSVCKRWLILVLGFFLDKLLFRLKWIISFSIKLVLGNLHSTIWWR